MMYKDMGTPGLSRHGLDFTHRNTMWNMHLGNPVALCDTQHAEKDIVKRPAVGIVFANDHDLIHMLIINKLILITQKYFN